MKKFIIILLFFCQILQAQNNWYSAVSSGTPHFKGISQLWLGRISGNYLMCENGDSLLITGKDFDSNWTQGIPYKSSCFISQTGKWKQATVKDTGNFWFAADGTPNLIPVVSLFQNIDYNCVIYTKHEAQMLDANSVEVYEPRISQICTYKTRQRSVDSILCDKYFAVPVMDASAKWVSPSGTDAAGRGTKALPWKTLSYAETNCTDNINQNVYVKSGYYAEATYLYSQKNINWKGIGRVKLTSVSTTYVILRGSSKVATFEGLSMSGSIQTQIVSVGITGGSTSFTRCRFDSVKSSGTTYGIKNNATYPLTFTRCVFNISTGLHNVYTVASIAFNLCMFNTSIPITLNSGSGTIDLTYNKITNNAATKFITGLAASAYNFNIRFNNFGGSNCYCFVENAGGGSTSNVIEYNTITFNTVSVSGFRFLKNCTTIFRNNSCTNNYNTIQSSPRTFLTVDNTSGNSRLSFYNNIFNCVGDYVEPLYYNAPSDLCDVYNNVINITTTINHGLAVGPEESSANDNLITNIHVYNNVINGNALHGIFNGHNSNSIFEKNNIKGCTEGFVCKGVTSVSGIIFKYNLIKNCSVGGILVASVKNSFFYDNTIYNSSETNYYSIRLWNDDAVGASGSTGNTIKNNILVDLINNSTNYIYTISDAASNVSNVFDNNRLYSAGNRACNYLSATKTFSEWQSLGNDANSLNQNPNLTSGLWPISAVTGGADLGATYQTGLDTTTTWGSSTTLPNIVTKNQSGSWQIGAYVK